ncbi:RNA polymerase II-associated protein 3 [Prorops nasuta]|uniref:RNA polymerase II-associated protein 3 n=1 Tax=Prorops nasuta TaxID=863751 RepID=UPI0034CD216D
MNPNKSFYLQKQVRDNTEDLQHELRDLMNWEKDMKKKEKELKNQISITDQILPTIRSKKNKKTESKVKEDKRDIKRIKSFDYESWNKFDVEKACKELDDDEETDESFEGPLSKEELLKSHDLAIEHKEKGNQFVKQENWAEAIACYTEAVKAFPYDAVFYANRALCQLKLNKFYFAETDCTRALQIDESYIKAYHRRAIARMETKQYKEATEDIAKLLELEPSNKQANLLLTEIEKRIECSKPVIIKSDNNKKSVDTDKNTRDPRIPDWLPEKDDVKVVDPIEKLPYLKSKVMLTQVPVKLFDFYSMKEIDSTLVTPENNKQIMPEEKVTVTSTSLERESEQKQIPPPPKTSVQFMTDWKADTSSEFRYDYLKQIPAEQIPQIFKESLDSDPLTEVITILKTEFLTKANPIYPYLKSLTKVKRFRALVMFISDKEKEGLRELLDHCQRIENIPEEEINLLHGMYEL